MKVKEQNGYLSALSLLHLMFIGSMGAAFAELFKQESIAWIMVLTFSFGASVLCTMTWVYLDFFKRIKKKRNKK